MVIAVILVIIIDIKLLTQHFTGLSVLFAFGISAIVSGWSLAFYNSLISLEERAKIIYFKSDGAKQAYVEFAKEVDHSDKRDFWLTIILSPFAVLILYILL